MMRRLLVAFSTVALGSLCGTEILAQCAMCGAAAASGKVGRGIAFSVFFLLGILFLIVSWFVVLVYRAQRNAGQASGGAPPPAEK